VSLKRERQTRTPWRIDDAAEVIENARLVIAALDDIISSHIRLKWRLSSELKHVYVSRSPAIPPTSLEYYMYTGSDHICHSTG
jgi:hypothetical protein